MARQPDQKQTVQYSFAIQTKDSVDISIGGSADYTWNSFWRAAYEKAAGGIQRQANMLLARKGRPTCCLHAAM
jgi:hypothetical protein